jgi:hypothetical protein
LSKLQHIPLSLAKDLARLGTEQLGDVLFADQMLWNVDVRCSLDSVAKVPKAAAAKFPPKNETSDNCRSIEPQTRCQNRL